MQTTRDEDLWLGHLVSFESSGEARESAGHLVDEFLRQETTRDRYPYLLTAREAARQAEDETIKGLYWIAHDYMAISPAPLNQTTQEEAGETGGEEEVDTEDETEQKKFHSSYNEFVSEQMKHYSDEERRSGEALKEIGRKWRERNN